jgi:hypothetical protein
VIIAVDGPSAAGKTTWIATHREQAAVIGENEGRIQIDGTASQLEPADYWAQVNARRWMMAVEAERRSQIVLCDTDPFKLNYTWSLWRAGHAPASDWRAARDASRRMFAAQRLGIADLILVRIPDQAVLAQQKAADQTRTRRNFELHRQLAEPLREWYRAVSELDAARVRWSFPATGTHGLTQLGTRYPRTGGELYDHLMDLLPVK